MPKLKVPKKGPLKPVQVLLDKRDTSRSDEGTLNISRGGGKP